jgi:hypothetical protein
MSADSPGGSWVDRNSPENPAKESPVADADVNSSGWFRSSMDLLDGADIVDGPDPDSEPSDEIAAFYPGIKPD